MGRGVLLVLVFTVVPAPGPSIADRIQTDLAYILGTEQIVKDFHVHGDSHVASLDKLRTWATKHGTPVYDLPLYKDVDLLGAASCFESFTGRRCIILLDSGGGKNNAFSTLIHELTHTRIAGANRIENEILAETVAYLTCANVKLNTKRESMSYLYSHTLIMHENIVADTIRAHEDKIAALVKEFTEAAQ